MPMNEVPVDRMQIDYFLEYIYEVPMPSNVCWAKEFFFECKYRLFQCKFFFLLPKSLPKMNGTIVG